MTSNLYHMVVSPVNKTLHPLKKAKKALISYFIYNLVSKKDSYFAIN